MIDAAKVVEIHDLILSREQGLHGSHGEGPLEGALARIESRIHYEGLDDVFEITGYDVVLWVEEQVVTRGFSPPKMSVHSANPSARLKMESGIRSIEARASVSHKH